MAVTAEEIRLRVLINGEVQDMPLDKFRGKLRGLDDESRLFGSTIKGLGPMIAGAFTTAGASAFLSVMKDLADEAAAVENGVREIGTLTGGLSPEQIKVMTKELGELSVSSGQAIDKLTKARYDIVSAGFSDSAKSLQVLNASARLAVGGVTDVSVAADLLTTALNAYRKGSDEANNVSDDLFTIVRNGKTTMSELGANMGALIATAGPLDVSLEEVGAALSTLTAQGQSTAMASTAVSASILEMSKPSRELTDALASLGIQTDNLIVSGHGYAGALTLVKKASEETGIPVNRLISREEALRAILSLTSTASQKFGNDLASMKNNAGEADKAFQEMTESTAFLGKQADESFNQAKRAVGDAIIETDLYRESLKNVRDFFGEITIAFTDAEKASKRSGSSITTAIVSIGNAAKWSGDQVAWMWEKLGSPSPSGIGNAIAGFGMTVGTNPLMFPVGISKAIEQYNNTIANEERKRRTEYDDPYKPVLSSVQQAIQRLKSSSYVDSFPTPPSAPQATPKLGINKQGPGKGSDELLKAQQELTRQIEDATTWYEKFTESIKGEYEATVEAAKSLDRLDLLLEKHIISEQQYITAIDRVSKKYHEALMSSDMSIDTSVWNLGPYASSGNASSDEYSKKVEKTTNAIYDLGYQLESSGITIKGWNDFSKSYESFADYFSPANQALGSNKDYNSLVQGIGQAVSGIGTVIGGNIGSAISSTANLAAAGATIGSAIPGVGTVAGAVVGGVVGLVSSIFGGGDDGPTQAQNDALAQSQQAANTVAQLAESGNVLAQQIMARAGYSVKNLGSTTYTGGTSTPASSFYGIGIDKYVQSDIQDLALFYTAENNYNEALLDHVENLGKVTDAINNLASPSILLVLDQISYKYEVIAAQSSDIADIEKAKLYEQFSLITGISADTMADMMSKSLSIATSAGQAGRVFAETFEAQVVASIKSMAISQTVNDAITPYLQPVMAQLVQGMIGGTMTASEMAALVEQAKLIAANVAPAVSALYTVFSDAGISSYAYSGQTDASSPVTMEARASGGPVYAGKQYKVNETRREVFVPFVDGTILPSTSAFGNSEIAVVMKELLMMLRQGQQALITIDGEQFSAFLERRRLKSEAKIAVSGNRLAKQVY